MLYVVLIGGGVSLLLLAPVLLRVRRAIRLSTLETAWRWAVACWFFWGVAWFSRLWPLAPSLHDQLWYAVAVLGLCPPIAVLGAKRPGSRAWTAFVVFPLVLVFSWFPFVDWFTQFPPDRLQLEVPLVLGYFLVLMMGYGNYLGTRHFGSSLLTAAALAWLVVQLFQGRAAEEPLGLSLNQNALGPTGLLGAAALIELIVTTRPSAGGTGPDRLWRDFQEAFGLVWARRVMDRINHTAAQEQWAARLELQGFVWNPDRTPAQEQRTRERIDHALRWLLRRFVDAAWIDQRLNE